MLFGVIIFFLFSSKSFPFKEYCKLLVEVSSVPFIFRVIFLLVILVIFFSILHSGLVLSKIYGPNW